jgi:hypothetical protein
MWWWTVNSAGQAIGQRTRAEQLRRTGGWAGQGKTKMNIPGDREGACQDSHPEVGSTEEESWGHELVRSSGGYGPALPFRGKGKCIP